jgi:hypothetical protein
VEKVAYHISDACDERTWDSFVRNHPRGHVFQLPDFYHAHALGPQTSAIARFAFFHSTLVGVMVGVVIRSSFGFLSARTIVRGGPLLAKGHEAVLALLLRSFNEKARTVSLVTQIRPLFPFPDTCAASLVSAGFSFESHLNFLNDLSSGELVMWQTVHRHRRRNIRKARHHLTVTRADGSALSSAYSILRHNYRRYRMPLLPINVFRRLYNSLSLKDEFLIFVVKKGEKTIGTLFALGLNRSLYCWYACSLQDSYKYYPNDLIHWEVMRWGTQNGYSQFDFGGAGSPQVPYGVRDFKRQYGGQERNVGRWTCIHHPLLYSVARRGFALLRNWI